MINTKKIWMNGEMIDHDNANVHVLSHVMHYGSSFFEGIRAYKTEAGTAIFRLDEHIDRLYNSCKIYRTEIPYSKEEIKKAIFDTIKINGIKTAYIRPLIYRGYQSLGVDPSKCPVETMIAAWEWGAYLGEEALIRGVDVCVSSWRRLAPNTIPTAAKAGGNYLSSQLIKMEALENGYDEGIALDYSGNVSEGSGENLFLVFDGKIYSPQAGSSALVGITRDSVITIARDLGYEVVEETLSRESLYTADEMFFTGTAAEITPIASVDKIKIGSGKRGPVTEKIQKAFFEMTEGKNPKYNSWLTFVTNIDSNFVTRKNPEYNSYLTYVK